MNCELFEMKIAKESEVKRSTVSITILIDAINKVNLMMHVLVFFTFTSVYDIN